MEAIVNRYDHRPDPESESLKLRLQHVYCMGRMEAVPVFC